MRGKTIAQGLAAILFCATSTTLFAEDAITTTVTAPAPPSTSVVIRNNGSSSGTIQLLYTFTGQHLPCGSSNAFATFSLALAGSTGTNTKTTPSYPQTLTFSTVQNGNGGPVQLSADPAGPFTINAMPWNTSSMVTVTLPDCNKIGTPTDGQEVNGMLNIATGTAHLATVSGVLVKVKLSIPSSTACLQPYSFETENDGTPLGSVTVTSNAKGIVKATQPGDISADGLVVNNCSTDQNFDMQVVLDPNWSTNPANNPGNAVFTYTFSGELDPSIFATAGTSNAEAVCLVNVPLQSGQSFLEVVHSQIDSGIASSSLSSSGNFNFSTVLYPAKTGCGGGSTNAAGTGSTASGTSTLSYTQK